MNDSTDSDKPKSWWQRLTGGLKRTSSAIGTAITDLVLKRKLDSAMLEEIEELLIRADLGVDVAFRIAQIWAPLWFRREEGLELLSRRRIFSGERNFL